jgi:transcriptional regulator with XRE-family HTH domain
MAAETFHLAESSRSLSARSRAKTSLRLKYEAETMVLKREIGGLEEIRMKLGFSRRKISQLLLVDPSAWTRWTSGEADAPPHIYRALKWYLDSKGHQFDKFEGLLSHLQFENESLKKDLVSVRAQMQRFKLIFYALFVGLIALVGVASALILARGP